MTTTVDVYWGTQGPSVQCKLSIFIVLFLLFQVLTIFQLFLVFHYNAKHTTLPHPNGMWGGHLRDPREVTGSSGNGCMLGKHTKHPNTTTWQLTTITWNRKCSAASTPGQCNETAQGYSETTGTGQEAPTTDKWDQKDEDNNNSASANTNAGEDDTDDGSHNWIMTSKIWVLYSHKYITCEYSTDF